jgi:hypothetical protein
MIQFFLLLISLPTLILYGTWAWAVVIQKTWLWFAVPAFAVTPFTFAQAISVSVFVSIFFAKSIPSNHPKTPNGEINWGAVVGNIIGGMILPWIILFLNFILACVFI